LTAKDLFQHQTVAELAPAAESAGAVAADQGPVSGPVPLTPMQHAFFEQPLTHPNGQQRAVELEVRQTLALELLDRAFTHVQQHHDAVRLRFTEQNGSWQQTNAAVDAITPIQRGAAAQSALDLANGPMVRLAYLDGGPGRNARLVLLVHRLVADNASVR